MSQTARAQPAREKHTESPNNEGSSGLPKLTACHFLCLLLCHFTDEQPEAQRGYCTIPDFNQHSQSCWMELGLVVSILSPQYLVRSRVHPRTPVSTFLPSPPQLHQTRIGCWITPVCTIPNLSALTFSDAVDITQQAPMSHQAISGGPSKCSWALPIVSYSLIHSQPRTALQFPAPP